MTRHPKRPRDPNQLAKTVVDLATMDNHELAKATAARERGTQLAKSAKPTDQESP